jgi:hypothetical protein
MQLGSCVTAALRGQAASEATRGVGRDFVARVEERLR